METWTLLAWVYFALDNAEGLFITLTIMSGLFLAIAVPVYAMEKDINGEAPFSFNYIRKTFVAFVVFLSLTSSLYIFLPSKDQMKILIGIEAASRIAHSEDAKRVAGKTVSAFEKLIDRLNGKK